MAQISFRMDDELKKSAEHTFRSMGMTMSTAITIFVTQTVRDGQFPFVIKSDPVYSPANLAVLRQRAQEMDAGRSVVSRELVQEAVREMRAANDRDWTEDEVNAEIAAARRARRGRAVAI